ncbi:MAG: hypothetical protein LUG87_00865, partial [Oscillospiraceae bacterium]|nr:hypothetical protein [Oscillospiraceae bacterium]
PPYKNPPGRVPNPHSPFCAKAVLQAAGLEDFSFFAPLCHVFTRRRAYYAILLQKIQALSRHIS